MWETRAFCASQLSQLSKYDQCHKNYHNHCHKFAGFIWAKFLVLRSLPIQCLTTIMGKEGYVKWWCVDDEVGKYPDVLCLSKAQTVATT
jgi:hypothetical protein